MLINRRDLIRTGAGSALLALAARVPAFAASKADPLWFVDPEFRPAARQIQGLPMKFDEAGLPAARKAMAGMAKPPLTTVPFEKRQVAGSNGSPPVTIYVINARPGARRGAILHTHGGGYIVGSAAENIRTLQEMAATLDCGIVTVDYRLAPETRWQGSLEDNYAGLRWLHTHAAEVGIDPDRIALMGESAGGGHAALLAITARDRGEIPLIFQSLTYPMLDDRTASSRSVPAHIGSLLWTGEHNRLGWKSFLGQEPGGSDVPAAAVPARQANLAGLPPAWIGVGGIDLFVHEDISYSDRLLNAGVPTELLVVPGGFHGFDIFAAETSGAKNFVASRLNALRRALAG